MTTTQEIEDAERCPFCGSNTDTDKLGRLGLSIDELGILRQHVRDGTLKDMLVIAQIAWRGLDPEKATSEFQVREAISKLSELSKTFFHETGKFIEKFAMENGVDKLQMVKEYEEKYKPFMETLQKDIAQSAKAIEKLEKQHSELNNNLMEIREKIVGTGIGSISEMVTIRDLKEVVPTDKFSEARASKGGTDIIGFVKENGTECGIITISNKCTKNWEGDYLTQLIRNMKDDGSRFGILVTKAFPREALSSKAYPVDVDNGRTVIVVKPEYAPLTYFGLRVATIHWFETRKALKRKEEEAEESEKTFKAIADWINGEEFEEAVQHIATARKAVEDTRRQLSSMRSYVNTQLDKAVKFQDLIDQNLIHTKSLIAKLRDLLNSGSSGTIC